MAYVVKYDDWWQTETWYYQYKENALSKFNELLDWAKLININKNKIPCKVEDKESWYSIERMRFGDTTDYYFLFLDDETNPIFVMGDEETFKAEYAKLQNKYRKNNWDFVDFYDRLSKNLLGKWVTINANIPILHHNEIKFE